MVNVAGYVLVFFLLERPSVAVDPAEPPETQINSVSLLGSEKNGLPPNVTKAVAVPVFLISKEVGGFDSVQFPPLVSSLMVNAFGLKTAVLPWPLIFDGGNRRREAVRSRRPRDNEVRTRGSSGRERHDGRQSDTSRSGQHGPVVQLSHL